MATVQLNPPRVVPAQSEPLSVRSTRIPEIDRLKVALVMGIIAGHGAMGYSDLERAWPYQDVQEVALPGGINIALAAVVLPAALFTMGLFFLISGMFTPASLDRKGPRRFARDRLVRLGLPLAVWVLAIWPALVWMTKLAAGQRPSYWSQFMAADPFLDTGPLWFVEVLLLYSLAYAAWCAWGRSTRRPLRVDGCTVTWLAIAISLSTVIVRMVFPLGSPQPAHPNLWQWPQYVGLFGLGLAAGRSGALQPVSRVLAHRCGIAAVAGLAGFVLLALVLAATGTDGDVIFHERLHWAPISLALIEGPISVGASVWALAFAQRRFAAPLGRGGIALARSAFAAFVLQGAVLIGLMIALRPVDLPAAVKAPLVAVLGTVAAFGLGWLVVSRTRLRRVL